MCSSNNVFLFPMPAHAYFLYSLSCYVYIEASHYYFWNLTILCLKHIIWWRIIFIQLVYVGQLTGPVYWAQLLGKVLDSLIYFRLVHSTITKRWNWVATAKNLLTARASCKISFCEKECEKLWFFFKRNRRLNDIPKK